MGDNAEASSSPAFSVSYDYNKTCRVVATGLETSTFSPGKTGVSEAEVAECNAVDARKGLTDADLRAIVNAWPKLSDADRKAVLRIVRRAAGKASGETGNVAGAD